MIKYKQLHIEEVQTIAFDPKTVESQAILLQDLLKRLKTIKHEEKLDDDRIIFLENTSTGEIRMEIV